MDELTIAFKIESPPSWLPIGRTAENNWRTVEIDCSYWFNMASDGTVVLMYKPSCGMSPYPLLTERDGDNIVWRPKSGELVEGVGRLQAFFEVGADVIGSSDMISCEVDSSLLSVDPGTDPGQTDLPWALDIIEQIAVLSGHYPKIIDGVLYIWDSTLNDWVEFEASGGGAVESVNGKTGVVVLDASDVGALPDDTQIPSKTSDLTNDSGFVTAQQAVESAPVQSVNGKTGAVSLGAADVHALPDSTVIPPTVTEQTVAGWGFTKNTGTYSKPSGGIPKTDLAQAVQTSLGKADTALQTAPVTSVNNKTGAVTLTASDVGALPSSTSIPTKTSDLTNDSGFQTAPFEIEVTQSGSTYSTTASAADILAHIDNCVLVEDGAVLQQAMHQVFGSYAVILFANNASVNGYIANASFVVTIDGTNVSVDYYSADAQPELPSVTASDNGKFLRVVSGAWAAQAESFQTQSITDTGGYYTTDTVEGALQEIGAELVGKADKTLRVAMTASDTTPTLNPNTFYVFPTMASLAPTLNTPSDNSIVNEYHFIFTSGATATTLTLPASVLQPDGFTVEANMHYEISILEGAMTAQGWAVSTS